MPTTKSLAGFTLIELVITLLILAIAIGFTTHSWSWWASKSRHRAILENYHGLFAYARWTAASQDTLITICPLSAKNICIDDWTQPVSVFLDSDNNKTPDAGSVLRLFRPNLGTYSLRSRTAGRGYFQFNSKGMTHGAMGSLVLCPGNPSEGTMSYMPVNIAGRFRAEHDRDRDGNIKLPWGDKISC
ncbi:type IV fimbrial biogenesis protein FimT [Marinobacter sp. es.048]|uniref:GspH/FimT family pseudopilin n=1 Tax=Marinobacter sp. es.048 TaxID=1761795 RepID=UPI000B595AB5|nr:GspH/FimT family pseudopilin [Marinobacter sp. es.048]SNC76526.1 type IV fimbrial biogenesis protein FimT [Marinobacter sp. es.048]